MFEAHVHRVKVEMAWNKSSKRTSGAGVPGLESPTKESPSIKCVGMSEQLALLLHDAVKLLFQDTDADSVVTVRYKYCMLAELHMHLYFPTTGNHVLLSFQPSEGVSK